MGQLFPNTMIDSSRLSRRSRHSFHQLVSGERASSFPEGSKRVQSRRLLHKIGKAPGSAINGMGEIANKLICKVRTHLGGFHPVVTLQAWRHSNLRGACQSSESLHSPLAVSTRLADQMWFESLVKAAWDSDSDSEYDQLDIDEYDETYADFAASKGDFTALTSSPELEFLPTPPTNLLYGSVDRQVKVTTGLWYPFIATIVGTKVDSKSNEDQEHCNSRCMAMCTLSSSPEPRPHIMSLQSLDTLQAGFDVDTPVSALRRHPSLELQQARKKLTQENHLHFEVGSENLGHQNAKDSDKPKSRSMAYPTDDLKMLTRMCQYERLRNQFRWRMIPSIEPLTEGITDPIIL